MAQIKVKIERMIKVGFMRVQKSNPNAAIQIIPHEDCDSRRNSFINQFIPLSPLCFEYNVSKRKRQSLAGEKIWPTHTESLVFA